MEKNNIQNQGNLIKATLVSSVVAPLPFIIATICIGSLGDFQLTQFIQLLFSVSLLIMLFAVPFTLTINFLLVLPMALLLRKINFLSSIYLCFWCSLIAFPAFKIYMTIPNNGPTQKADVLIIVLSTLCGLCSGIIFCRIAKIKMKPSHLT